MPEPGGGDGKEDGLRARTERRMIHEKVYEEEVSYRFRGCPQELV